MRRSSRRCRASAARSGRCSAPTASPRRSPSTRPTSCCTATPTPARSRARSERSRSTTSPSPCWARTSGCSRWRARSARRPRSTDQAFEKLRGVFTRDVGGLLFEQAELFRAQSARHRLDLQLPDGPVTALGDRDRLAQVVANLLSNAIKYSPDGGRVCVEGAMNGSKVTVAVRDEGIGIPADQQAQVFERFFRAETPEAHSIGGTGLGLALCRELVEAHGGRIGFESEPGRGSTFWFTLGTSRAQSTVRF